jgi:hypothetical protein
MQKQADCQPPLHEFGRAIVSPASVAGAALASAGFDFGDAVATDGWPVNLDDLDVLFAQVPGEFER